ncbi:MAG TPA: type II toxin-antitoxin system HicB family antitoxin [Ktedonobacterales bacterium]|nr:type II toxin-antitoxin system HicB family antitoxin [Ktedonobacterales bacterium]
MRVALWSDENQAFMVSVPEFPGNYTHGETYEQAVKQGEDLIESLIMWAQQDGQALPPPRAFAMHA